MRPFSGFWARFTLISASCTVLACMPLPPRPRPPPPENYVVKGLTLPPSGPRALGPMTPASHLEFEVSGTVVGVRASPKSMEDGALGNLIPTFTGSGRIAYGVSRRLELGANWTYANRSLATPVAKDATSSGLEGSSVWQLDTTARFEVLRVGEVSLLVGGEVGAGPIHYTLYDISSPGDGGAPDDMPWAQTRADFEVLYRVTSGLTASTGFSVQRFRLFYRSTVHYGCDFQSCSQLNDPSTGQDVGFATPFASLSYRFGDLTLLASAFAPLTANRDLREAAPGGAALSVRYSFDPWAWAFRGFGFDRGPPPPL